MKFLRFCIVDIVLDGGVMNEGKEREERKEEEM
jgi:hypothetical protein